MFGFLKKLFGAKPTVNPCPEAPYKVETPAPVVEAEAPKAAPAPKKKTAGKKPSTPKKGQAKNKAKPTPSR